MKCNCCFYDFLAKCETEVVINAILSATTEYRWVITDKFDNMYEGTATTDADGHLAIPITDLPPGLLTQYSGDFKLEIYQGESCTPIKFKIAGEFDCISFEVKGGSFEKNYLGCPVEAVV
jgi:hypothetical protein